MKLKIILGLSFFCSIFITSVASADTNSSETTKTSPEPPKIGNFIFPESQQPGPLLSFGQNIIDKNETIIYLSPDDFQGHDKHMIDIVPSMVYGITDKFSAFLNVPIAASFKDQQNHSSGFEDIFLQFEYAFYAKATYAYTDQATVVTNVTFPTGSSTVQPPTGFGSPSFFYGVTFERTYVDWFLFTSPGAVLTTSEDNTKFGDQFLYQAGIGRNIFDIDTSWLFASMVEVNGIYSEKNKISGVIDPNSGGNTVYVTPSLWISSKNLIFQFGVGFPIIQDLFGSQRTNNYLLALSLGWAFYGK